MKKAEQIKTRQRVSDLGEVFTASREVKAMVSLVREQAKDIEATFLEPACGTGNFLDEILSRKLAAASRAARGSEPELARLALIAVSSLYGIDIMPDNVRETRIRLERRVLSWFSMRSVLPFPHQGAIDAILMRNIQCGDTLRMLGADGTPLVISEWRFSGDIARRSDCLYSEMVATGSEAAAAQVFSFKSIEDIGREACTGIRLKHGEGEQRWQAAR